MRQTDLALLPQLSPGPDPGLDLRRRHVPMKCDYRLMIDNLMDLTHEKYVRDQHRPQELDEVPAHTSSEGDVVITRREMSGVKAPLFWQAAMRGKRPGGAGEIAGSAAKLFRAAVERA